MIKKRFITLCFLLFSLNTLSDDTKSVETRLIQVAFPESKLLNAGLESLTQSKPEVAQAIQDLKEEWLKTLILHSDLYFKSLLGTKTSTETQRILRFGVELAPWYLNPGIEQPLVYEESGIGFMAKKVGGGSTAIAFVVKQKSLNKIKKTVLASVFESALFYKYYGTNKSFLKENKKKASALLQTLNLKTQTLLDSCPGPYSEEDLSILEERGSLVLQNITATNRLKLKELSDRLLIKKKKCPALLGSTPFKKIKFEKAFKLYRCDSLCKVLLCRKDLHFPQLIQSGSLVRVLVEDYDTTLEAHALTNASHRFLAQYLNEEEWISCLKISGERLGQAHFYTR